MFWPNSPSGKLLTRDKLSLSGKLLRGTIFAWLVAWPCVLLAQQPDPPVVEDTAADEAGPETPAVLVPADAEAPDVQAPDGQTADSQTADSQTADSQTADSQTADSQTADSQTADSQAGGSLTEERREPTAAEKAEYEEEVQRRLKVFQDMRLELEQVIWEQREIYINYSNHDDRNPAAKQAFLEKRGQVRQLLDATYLAALDVCRIAADPPSARFVITMIQHRFERDIYDASTMEGAARMIDGGSNLAYLYLSAARSAMVCGNFDMAKRLYETIEDEQKEEVDMGLQFYLDTIQENFVAEQAAREKEAREDRLPRVLLRTSQGDVLVELFIDSAPSTVAHFISLVEDRFYDGLDFYQVIDHLLALTGDPSGAGDGNCGQYILDEHQREDARKGFRGSLVMAKLPYGKTGKFIPNSASSQFAILMLPVTHVSSEQTVFGRVIEGMDAISRLRRVDPSKKKKKGAIVQPPDLILEATVVRRPETLPKSNYFQVGQQIPGIHEHGDHEHGDHEHGDHEQDTP